MSIKDIKINKKAVQVFSSFTEVEAEEKEFWLKKSPAERLAALELMRQSAYGYEDATSGRLQRVFEVVKG